MKTLRLACFFPFLVVLVSSGCVKGPSEPVDYHLDSKQDAFFYRGFIASFLHLNPDGRYSWYQREGGLPVEYDSGSWRQLPSEVVQLSSDWRRRDIEYQDLLVPGRLSDDELRMIQGAIREFLETRSEDRFTEAEVEGIASQSVDDSVAEELSFKPPLAISRIYAMKMPAEAFDTERLQGDDVDPEISALVFVTRADLEGLIAAIDEYLSSETRNVFSFTPFAYRGQVYLEWHDFDFSPFRSRDAILAEVSNHGDADPRLLKVWYAVSREFFEEGTAGAELSSDHPRRRQEFEEMIEGLKARKDPDQG